MPANFITPWSLRASSGEQATIEAESVEAASVALFIDNERHQRFMAYARCIAEQHYPWLFRMLDAADAEVVLGPGFMAVRFTGGPWVNLPEMAGLFGLTPWLEDGEVAH